MQEESVYPGRKLNDPIGFVCPRRQQRRNRFVEGDESSFFPNRQTEKIGISDLLMSDDAATKGSYRVGECQIVAPEFVVVILRIPLEKGDRRRWVKRIFGDGPIR